MYEAEEKQLDGWSVLQVSGSVDASCAPELEQQVTTWLEAEPERAAIDMAGVSYLSSAGLRVLLRALKIVRKGQGRLRLLSPQPEVKKILDMAGFTELFEIADSVD